MMYGVRLTKSAQRGFTLTELLLSLAVIFIISAFSFPVGMNFYKTEILHETTDELSSTLRRAYTQSVGQRNDASYGIRIFEHHYVLFEGTDYESRNVDEDEIFQMPSSVSITGLTEVMFEKMTGMPNEAGYIRISIGNEEELIRINTLGVIEV